MAGLVLGCCAVLRGHEEALASPATLLARQVKSAATSHSAESGERCQLKVPTPRGTRGTAGRLRSKQRGKQAPRQHPPSRAGSSLLDQGPIELADPTFTPFPAPSQVTRPLPLRDALDLALRNSPDLRAYAEQIRLAKAQLRSRYVPYNPTFTMQAQNLRVQNAIPSDLFKYAGLVQNQYTFYATIQQLIYDFGRVHWSSLAARLNELQTRQSYRTQLEILLQTVETLYLNATLSDINVRIARQRVAERRSALKISANLQQGGFVAGYDVLQYKSQLGQALQQLLVSQGAAEKAHEALVVALGLPPGTQVALETPVELPPPPANPREGLERALVRRPEVAALSWSVHAAEANIQAAARTSAPTVTMQAQYQGTNPYLGGSFVASQLNLVAALNIPIVDGHLAHWEKKQAEATLAQAQHQLASVRRSVEQDVVAAYADLETYWRQIQLARETAAQAQEANKIATLRYREGFSSSLELLNAQDTYVQANQSVAIAEFNYRVAQVSWRRAISGDYPVSLPDSVKVDWTLPPPLTAPATQPVGPVLELHPSPAPSPSPSPSRGAVR